MPEDPSKKRSRQESPPRDDHPSRRSRFESSSSSSNGASSAAAIAAARAQEITRSLQGQGQEGSTEQERREKALKEARAKEIQAQIAAQMASVTNMLANAQKEKKAAYRPLLLDSSGREIDEKGQVVVRDSGPVRTLAANVAVVKAKRENPYLAHRAKSDTVHSSNVEGIEGESKSEVPVTVDPRIKAPSRDLKAKRSFNFVEEGSYVKEADKLRQKEERKIIAGYSSGRKRPDQEGGVEAFEGQEQENSEENMMNIYGRGSVHEDHNEEKNITVPPPPDGGVVPSMEWWDTAFLPKQTRELRRRSKAAQQQDDSDKLSISHCRTYKYVQHPVPVKPLGGERAPEPLKMYLTQKERKRIRRTARHEREMEKRDKIMMGLIPAPEPKFKLSNFMKILGDQAVSDPSKVEQRVVQQMQQRKLNHQMRNEARKLTPAERREKKKKKLQEDTSRQVHVAIFRVKDFSDPKHQFKVDVNMQQLNLSGVVVLCPSAATNLVVAEGGPKGIKKMIHLMTNRVAWTKGSEDISKRGGTGPRRGAPLGLERYGRNANYPGEEEEEHLETKHDEDGGETADTIKEETEEDIDDEVNDDNGLEELGLNSDKSNNRCDLLWQGVLPKKAFHVLRFQECRSSGAARKVLEAKGVAHYWDMAMRADEILASQSTSY